jgi:3-oxoacyl-[acyl-carrier protein] reductase
MDLGLKNRRVLITGGSRGIGAAIASAFLLEGANVLLVSRGSKVLLRTQSELSERHGVERVHIEVCDCADHSAMSDLRVKVERLWGSLDIVVANVGDGRGSYDPLPKEMDWQETWDSNFHSALFTARAFVPLLRLSKGCLLFISSIAAMEAFGAPVDYGTAKAAVAALGKNMARKLAEEIRINVLAPGNIFAPGGSWEEKIRNDSNEVDKMIQDKVPMKRFGTPEEVAAAAVFLCSSQASFITGATLTIDGGQTVGIF